MAFRYTEEELIQNAERFAKRRYLQEMIVDEGFDAQMFMQFCGKDSVETGIDELNFEELQRLTITFKSQILDEKIQLGKVKKHRVKVNKQRSMSNPHAGKLIIPQLCEKCSQQEHELNMKLPAVDFHQHTSLLDTNPLATAPSLTSERPDYPISYSLSGIEEAQDQTSDIEQQSQTGLTSEPAEDILEEFVACQPPPTTELTNVKGQITCNVVNTVLIKGGLFSDTYTAYQIYTNPCKWTVARRFSDFVWLSDRLNVVYPGVYIPPLPHKDHQGPITNEAAAKRQNGLKLFLNSIVQSDLLRSSVELHAFLDPAEEVLFRTLRGGKVKKAASLAEFIGRNGRLDLNWDRNSQPFDQYENYLGLAEILLKRLKTQSKQLHKGLEQLSTTLNNLSNTLHQLSELQTMNSVTTPLQTAYKELAQVIAIWKEDEKYKADLVGSNFTHYFDYARKEAPAMRVFMSQRNDHLATLEKGEQLLRARKENLWNKKDFASCLLGRRILSPDQLLQDRELAFKFMLPTETERVAHMDLIYAYYNYMCNFEVFQTLEIRAKTEVQHFTRFANSMEERAQEQRIRWAALKSQLTNI